MKQHAPAVHYGRTAGARSLDEGGADGLVNNVHRHLPRTNGLLGNDAARIDIRLTQRGCVDDDVVFVGALGLLERGAPRPDVSR